MNTTYIRILRAIELFAKEHLQIQKFSSDFPEQLPNFATKDEAYPILYVSPSNTVFDLNTNRFDLRVFCYDVIQKDRTNINTILSDTNSILNDLVLWLREGDLAGIDLINEPNVSPINNDLLDYVAGWELTLTLEVDTYTVCDIPFNETPIVTDIVNNIVYASYLTCDTLAECDTFNNAIDNLQEQIDNLPGEQGLNSVLGVEDTAYGKNINIYGGNIRVKTEDEQSRLSIDTDGFTTTDDMNGWQQNITYKKWSQSKQNKGWELNADEGFYIKFNENDIRTKITNLDVTEEITLKVPNKTGGEYFIATTEDLPTPQDINSVLGVGDAAFGKNFYLYSEDNTKLTTIKPGNIFTGEPDTGGSLLFNNGIEFRKKQTGSADIVQKLILNQLQDNNYEPTFVLPSRDDNQDYVLVTQEQIENFIEDAPIDGTSYIRQDGNWINVGNYIPSFKNIVENGGNNTVTDASKVISFDGGGYTSYMNSVGFKASLYTGAYADLQPGILKLKTLASGGEAILRYTGSSANNFYLPSKPSGNYILSTLNDLNDYVPYTGASKNVNIGQYGYIGNYIQFNTGATETNAVGKLNWNDVDGTLDLGLKGGNVTLQLGQESVVRVVNKTATNIDLLESNYQAVRITGAQGNRLKVDLAQANNDLNSAETIGIVTETIANNQEGFITTNGLVRGINTTGSLQGETWADGDMLYLSPTVAGQLTKIKPVAPQHLVVIGYVVRAHVTQGQIFVKVDNGYELDELHNVRISGETNNDVLTYNGSTQVWENKSVVDALGYEPMNDLQIRRKGITIYDDLFGTGASDFYQKLTFNSGSWAQSTFSNENNPGVIAISSTSGTTFGGGSIIPASTAAPRFGFITLNSSFDLVMRTSSLGSNIFVRLGMIAGSVNTTQPTDGIYFTLNNNSLIGQAASGNVRSSTVPYTGIVGTTWYHFRVKLVSTSLARYELYDMDGTLLWSDTISTNIPPIGTAIQPTFIAYNTLAEARQICQVDYIGYTFPPMNRGALT